jgi:hypothetical protein
MLAYIVTTLGIWMSAHNMANTLYLALFTQAQSILSFLERGKRTMQRWESAEPARQEEN